MIVRNETPGPAYLRPWGPCGIPCVVVPPGGEVWLDRETALRLSVCGEAVAGTPGMRRVVRLR